MAKRATAIVFVSFVLALAGCKKAANLAKYKDRATALAAKYAPKLGELSKRLPDLASRAKDLPVNVPGADAVTKLLADNKSTLEQAQDVLAKLPSQIASDTPEEAEKALDEADKTLAKDVAAAEKDEKEEAADLDQIQAAKAGSGSAGAAPATGSANAKK